MPHIVIEYSENLTDSVKSSNVLELVHQLVMDSGLFSPEAVKARSIAYDDYVMHAGGRNFLHITTSILSGRTLEERQTLNQHIFETARKAVADVDKLSCDIREMDREVYKK